MEACSFDTLDERALDGNYGLSGTLFFGIISIPKTIPPKHIFLSLRYLGVARAIPFCFES